MNLTVEFNPYEFKSSHMESSTEFIKKFFFSWSPQFSAFEHRTKIHQTGTCHFNGSPPSRHSPKQP